MVLWDSEPTLNQKKTLHPFFSHTDFRGNTIEPMILFMSQSQADAASYEDPAQEGW